MKSFEEIYLELNNGDEELINLWNNAKKKNIIVKIISGIIAYILSAFINYSIYGQRYELECFLFFVFMGLFLSYIVYFIVSKITGFSKMDSNLKKSFKSIAIEKLINNFYEDVNYNPFYGIDSNIYKKGKYGFYDTYNSDDYIKAKLDDCTLQMAEVLTKKIYYDSDGDARERVLFNGLFANINLNKSINSKLKIVANNIFEKEIFSKKEVALDDDEFNKEFKVYSDNENLAVRFLTADIMQDILEFKINSKMDIDIYIDNNQLYVRFHSGPMFEMGKYKGDFWNEKLLKRYYYMLKFTADLSRKIITTIDEKEI